MPTEISTATKESQPAQDTCIFIIADCSSAHILARTSPFLSRGFHVEALSEHASKKADYVVHSLLDNKSSIYSPRNIWAHFQSIRSCRADLFHVHYAASVGAWLFLISGRREPLVVSVMGGDILDKEQNILPRIARWMTTQVVRRADCVTYKTEHLKAELISRGVLPERTKKIVWGIDRGIFKTVYAEDIRKKINIDQHAQVLFSPRAMQPLYNIHILLKAMPLVLREYPDSVLILSELAADQEYREKLQILARKLGIIESIRWIPPLNLNQMPYYYSLADVVVSIPESDGLPQSVIESLICGTPCVIADLDNYSDVFGVDSGALQTPIDPHEVAASIKKVLDRPDQLKHKLNSPQGIKSSYPDARTELNKIEAVYRCLIKSGSQGPISFHLRLICALSMLFVSFKKMIVSCAVGVFQISKPDNYRKFP